MYHVITLVGKACIFKNDGGPHMSKMDAHMDPGKKVMIGQEEVFYFNDSDHSFVPFMMGSQKFYFLKREIESSLHEVHH